MGDGNEKKMDALEKNKTWDLVEVHKARNVFGFKWVYKLRKASMEMLKV